IARTAPFSAGLPALLSAPVTGSSVQILMMALPPDPLLPGSLMSPLASPVSSPAIISTVRAEKTAIGDLTAREETAGCRGEGLTTGRGEDTGCRGVGLAPGCEEIAGMTGCGRGVVGMTGCARGGSACAPARPSVRISRAISAW